MIKNYLVERPIYNVFDYPRQTQVFEDTVFSEFTHLITFGQFTTEGIYCIAT